MELYNVNDMEVLEKGELQHGDNGCGENKDPLEKRIEKPPLLLLWQLIPFFRRVFIYFVIIALDNEGVIDVHIVLKAMLTCAPLLTLAVFIFRQFNSVHKLLCNSYGTLIFSGLFMAMIGAMIVAFHHNIEILFVIGKSLHLVSLILYAFAFGFFPFASRMLLRSIIAGSLGYYYLYIGAAGFSQRFDLVSKVGTGLYIAAFLGMQWRAWARVCYQDLKRGRWYEFIGALGATAIVLGECVTAIDRFLKPSDANYFLLGANYSIQAFFFLGNLGIALSVLDGPNIIWPPEKAIESEKSESSSSKESEMEKSGSSTKKFIIGAFDWFFS